LGVLVSSVSRNVIDAAVQACEVGAKRAGGKPPPHVVAYLTMGLWVFADDLYEEVATKVTGGLDRFDCWDAGWTVPTSSGITQGRKRLGAKAMRLVFEQVAEPVAMPTTRGAWLRGLRLLAIDGFDADVPDSTVRAARGQRQSRRTATRREHAWKNSSIVGACIGGEFAVRLRQFNPWHFSC